MRIVGGQYRGRIVSAPKGDGARPTLDRVRESLMSSIYSIKGNFDGLRFLDAFAGSGALGIEALSRGAEFVLFTDSSNKSIACIEYNIRNIGIESERYKVLRRDVLSSGLGCAQGRFDVVLLDPPYAADPSQVIRAIDEASNLPECFDEDCLFAYEHSSSSSLQGPLEDALQADLIRTKRFGSTTVDLFRLSG